MSVRGGDAAAGTPEGRGGGGGGGGGGNRQEEGGQQQGEGGGRPASYSLKLRLLVCMLPAMLDLITDMPVLLSLWRGGHGRLLAMGIGIDLLPGPLTCLQFSAMGYKRLCLLLLIHPLNVLVFTGLGLCEPNPRATELSTRVSAFLHEAQAAVESPLQVIFTVSLMCHAILPPPWGRSITWTNAFGGEIALDFLPTLSVAFSVISTVFNAGRSVNLLHHWRTDPLRTLLWTAFLMANVTFRLMAWSVLSTFLVEFVVVPAVLMILVNAAILHVLPDRLGLDPLLPVLYSVTLPLAFLQSVHGAEAIEREFKQVSETMATLSLAGTALLTAAVWAVFLAFDRLPYNDQIVVERDALLSIIVATTAMGVASAASALVIYVPRVQIRSWGLKLLLLLLRLAGRRRRRIQTLAGNAETTIELASRDSEQ